jgi:uncharacterized protein (TIGR03437 family)
MKRLLPSLTLILLFCTAAFAQTTTLTVNATGSLTGSTLAGTASITGVGSNLAFSANVTLGQNITAAFTITVSSGNTITGTITAPATLLTGQGGTGSATITGGTGAHQGASGTFPNLTGTGSITASGLALTFTGTSTNFRAGGGTTTPTPNIVDVLDAASYTRNVARGSIFVVKGTNLSASGFTQYSFPLPTRPPENVRITFTTSTGQSTDAFLIYLYNQGGVNQLAAIAPSSLAPGNYSVSVTTANGSSNSFLTQVVNQKPGIITADSTGSGLAVVQNFISQSQLDIDRFTTFSASGYTFSPAKPGQVVIAWMTGLGPLPSGTDNTASAAVDFRSSKRIRAVVGGREIEALYAGRAPGLAGADQVNFVLPADVQTGCVVPFTVSVDNQSSNASFIAIAPNAAAQECVQEGYTAAQLRNFDQGGSITTGNFTLTSLQMTMPQIGTVKANSVGGSFTRLTGFQLNSASNLQVSSSTSGACTVVRIRGSVEQLAGGGTAKGLDAGAVTLTGPAGSNINNGVALTKSAENSYSLSLGFEGAGIPSLPGQINANLVAGQYRIAGAGGTEVGSFNSTITLGSPLTIPAPGLPSVVTRASGLPLTWSGGNANDVVQIVGYTGTNSGTGQSIVVDAVQFICTTTAGRGGFTVPADILTQLQPVTAAQISAGSASGYLAVMSSPAPVTFSAPLVGGGSIDNATWAAFTGIAGFPAYQ